MINSDPAGHCNVLWPGSPVKAARAWTCPSPQGSSSPCSLPSCAELLRRIIFGQKKTEKSHPDCEACMNREQPTAHPAAELFSFHVIHPCLKQPLTRFRGETTQAWDKAVSVPIRWALNLRLRIEHAWLPTEQVTHLCSYTLLVSSFCLFLWWLEQVLAFGGWNLMNTKVLSNTTLSMILYERFPCYICVHINLNYIFILWFPPLIRWWLSCPNGLGWGLWFGRHTFSCQRCPLTATIWLWERTNLVAHKQAVCSSALWHGR